MTLFGKVSFWLIRIYMMQVFIFLWPVRDSFALLTFGICFLLVSQLLPQK